MTFTPSAQSRTLLPTEEGIDLVWAVKTRADERTAGELLKRGQYKQVADVLCQAQTITERRGDAVLAHVLAVVHRICLAGGQCRAEAEWHQWAYQEADRRERELRQQLFAILDLIDEDGMLEMPEKQARPPTAPTVEMSLLERDQPEIRVRLGPWQLPWNLPAQRQPSPSDDRQMPLTPVGRSAATLLAPQHQEASASPPDKKKQKKQTPPSLVVYCLGPFRVYQNDRLITEWNGLKSQSILKYLLAHLGTPVQKDILMDLFWPDADPEAARRNLHQAVYSLRQTLRRGHPDFEHILFENNCYAFNSEMEIWIASREFEKHVLAGRRLEAAGRLVEAMAEYGVAEGLYQGDFMENVLYEDWPRLQREHMRNMYLKIVNRLSEYYMQQTNYPPAITLCQKILARDNCYEDAHRRLMQCYQAQGQRHLAVRQYQLCVQALKEELDLPPAKETVDLYHCIASAA